MNETFVSLVYGREFGLNVRDITSKDKLSRSNEAIVTLLLQQNMDDNIARQSETSNRNSFACHENVDYYHIWRKFKETEHDKSAILKI
jgi:hypothetical protein